MHNHHDAATGQPGELKSHRELLRFTVQMNLLHLDVPELVSVGEYKIKTRIINLGVENVKGQIRIAVPQLACNVGHQAMDKNVLNVRRTLGESFDICG